MKSNFNSIALNSEVQQNDISLGSFYSKNGNQSINKQATEYRNALINNESVLKIDYPNLYKLAESNQKKYLEEEPFPNIHIHDFFNEPTFRRILSVFPSLNSNIWKSPTNVHTVGKSVTKQGKLALKELLYTEAQRRILMEFNSSLFVTFLEKITGIEGLIPDPYFAEGSFTMSTNGGYLDIHADFSHHDKLKLERRVNVLIYLNENWKENFGGGLNLYDEDLTKKKTIFPYGNSIAIFTTSDKSFHGFPEKIKCPKHIQRKSINLYYYTVPTKSREVKKILFPEDPSFSHQPTKS